jgi:serine/threonine-protein kinase HipA
MKTKAGKERETYQVFMDAQDLDVDEQVGFLHRSLRNTGDPAYFEHIDSWLSNPNRFALDPKVLLHQGVQYPAADTHGFGIFLDSAPDRWGRQLMERREAAEAIRDNRPIRALREVDFLLGVHDLTRMGALRFCKADGPFLDDREHAAPPATSLAELAHVSRLLEEPGAESMPEYEKWLSMLLAPGSSLGGARPKANFTDADNTLWFAKFPAGEDRIDIGGWEFLTHTLAHNAGVIVPNARAERFNSRHHTFCVQRFDRTADSRRMYVSAMTLLERNDGEPGASYLDLAQLLTDNCPAGHVDEDLAQLYRRVIFNVLIGNRDDHLRNHGCLREPNGWRLAPAFDMNPNTYKQEHALTLNGSLAKSDLQAVRDTIDFYHLSKTDAAQIEAEVTAAVTPWREQAAGLGLSRAEIQRMESLAFLI